MYAADFVVFAFDLNRQFLKKRTVDFYPASNVMYLMIRILQQRTELDGRYWVFIRCQLICTAALGKYMLLFCPNVLQKQSGQVIACPLFYLIGFINDRRYSMFLRLSYYGLAAGIRPFY